MLDLRNISRVDTYTPDGKSETHGYQVRFRRNGERFCKFFNDNHHGGPEGALQAAAVYRDQRLQELPPPQKSRRPPGASGVRGISFALKREGRKRKLYVQCFWVDPDGTKRARSFRVERLGARAAVWNACLAIARVQGISDPTKVNEMFSTAYRNLVEQYHSRLKRKACLT